MAGNMGFLIRVRESLLDAVYPPRCMACGDLLATGPEGREARQRAMTLAGSGSSFEAVAAPWLCPDCRNGCEAVESPFCPVCGLPFETDEGPDHPCSDCMEKAPRFDSARAAGIYDSALARAVRQFKYGGRTDLARPLGALLFQGFGRFFGDAPPEAVVVVPLHRKRLRQRGFNQARLLAGALEKTRGASRVLGEVLVRHRATRRQAGLGIRERRKNIRGAFSLVRPEEIRGRRVLLVDDVLTTGATADECARVLKKGGAARVDILTLARVP